MDLDHVLLCKARIRACEFHIRSVLAPVHDGYLMVSRLRDRHIGQARPFRLDNLENLVKERTTELEKAFDLLKKSEKDLVEAQKISHVGNWNWNIVTN